MILKGRCNRDIDKQKKIFQLLAANFNFLENFQKIFIKNPLLKIYKDFSLTDNFFGNVKKILIFCPFSPNNHFYKL